MALIIRSRPAFVRQVSLADSSAHACNRTCQVRGNSAVIHALRAWSTERAWPIFRCATAIGRRSIKPVVLPTMAP